MLIFNDNSKDNNVSINNNINQYNTTRTNDDYASVADCRLTWC